MDVATVAKIAVENSVYHFDKAFDYLVPEELLSLARPGLPRDRAVRSGQRKAPGDYFRA